MLIREGGLLKIPTFRWGAYYGNQAKGMAYFPELKNDVGPKNMKQTSLLVVFTCLFSVIFTLVPVFTVS